MLGIKCTHRLKKVIYLISALILVYLLLLLIISFTKIYSSTLSSSVASSSFREFRRAFNTSSTLPPPAPPRLYTTVLPPGVIMTQRGGIGIGNQLFGYACAYALAKRRNWPLYVNIPSSGLENRRFTPSTREFALDKFQIPLQNLVTLGSTKFPRGGPRRVTDEILLNISTIQSLREVLLTVGSFCQSEAYWKVYKDDLKSMFQPKLSSVNLTKLEHLIKQIEESDSVAVHVRRGDFLRSAAFFVPMSFHRRAIPLMVDILNRTQGVKKPTFYIFSDDIKHVRLKMKDLAGKYNFVFGSELIGSTSSIEDFYLMMRCKHIIFQNSTFGWWTAYLNKNERKVVITSAFIPGFWKRKRDLNRRQFYMKLHGSLYHPKEWIVIDPFTGGLASDSSSNLTSF